jgi:hypothetical protein
MVNDQFKSQKKVNQLQKNVKFFPASGRAAETSPLKPKPRKLQVKRLICSFFFLINNKISN